MGVSSLYLDRGLELSSVAYMMRLSLVEVVGVGVGDGGGDVVCQG
jgi:hypothetical protein